MRSWIRAYLGAVVRSAIAGALIGGACAAVVYAVTMFVDLRAGYWVFVPDWRLCWLVLAVVGFVADLPKSIARTYRARKAEKVGGTLDGFVTQLGAARAKVEALHRMVDEVEDVPEDVRRDVDARDAEVAEMERDIVAAYVAGTRATQTGARPPGTDESACPPRMPAWLWERWLALPVSEREAAITRLRDLHLP